MTSVINLESRSGARPAARNHLTLIVRDDESPFRLVPVRGASVVVGRADDAEVRISDDGVSRKQVRFFYRKGAWYVEDLESRNGTLVDDTDLDGPVRLRGGERLFMGRDASIRVSLDDAKEQTAAVELIAAATRDPLTGLYNRRYLDSRLEEELSFAQRHGTALSVLMIDLDRFKDINDRHSHLAGDVVLRVAGRLLRKILRAEDVVARYGGEEFVVIGRDLDAANARILGERVRRALARTFVPWEGQSIAITVSIGIATHHHRHPYRSVADLLGVADSALYEAKRTGRNRCVSAH